MLPATVQFIIAMIASALADRLTRKMEYMREEQRILLELLHQATGKKRIAFTADHRRRLAFKGKELPAKERKACCHIVRPETILAWYRQLGARKYESSCTRNVGRPRKPDEVRNLVLRFAYENLAWGYTKIRDALRGLKIEIGRTTVANILAQLTLSASSSPSATSASITSSCLVKPTCDILFANTSPTTTPNDITKASVASF
ncbi:MAG: hypothetical protein SF187_29405 [Deltaproteobacteria bacterium]|nr:hypothetical protein [Deltaproteobacteria bacterium]